MDKKQKIMNKPHFSSFKEIEEESFIFLTRARHDPWVQITNMYIRKTKYKTMRRLYNKYPDGDYTANCRRRGDSTQK